MSKYIIYSIKSSSAQIDFNFTLDHYYINLKLLCMENDLITQFDSELFQQELILRRTYRAKIICTIAITLILTLL